MSHFNVAVFSYHPEDVEELLAPYDEQTEDEEYLEFEKAYESIEGIRAEYELSKQDGEGFDAFVYRWYGYIYNKELDAYGFYNNPNTKWDWWEIGGRWHNELRLKQGERCDQAQVRDVDFSQNAAAAAAAQRFWEVFVEGQPLTEDENPEDFKSIFSKEYYIDQYGAKETYVKMKSGFSCWAFLTPDGEWRENGRMGWFGIGDDTKESRARFSLELERMLKSSPDLWITIVDCHI